MTQTFKIGDVVRLKSGGPSMTVAEYAQFGYREDYSYKCRWFDEKNKLTEALFVEHELELATLR